MSTVTRIPLPSTAAAEVIAQLSAQHQASGLDFLLAIVIDKEGDCFMYTAADDAAPAAVTHVLGTSLAALHAEALKRRPDNADNG